MNALIFIALLNAGSVTLDGYSTLYHSEVDYRGHHFTRPPERGPARYLIGAYPTWRSMEPWGAADVVALTTGSYLMCRAHWRGWWMPQVAVSMVHLCCARRNFYVRAGDKKRMDALIAADNQQSAKIAYLFNF